MAYCGPKGIPYREWIGGEPGWDDLSRAAAVAWQRHEAERCSSCGQRAVDWRRLDDDGRPMVDDAGNPLWQIPLPYKAESHWCPGCAVLDGAKDQVKDQPALHLHLAPAASSPPPRPPG